MGNPVVNYLTEKQVYDYMAEVKKNDNLFTLIHESSQLKMYTTEGVPPDGMNGIADTIIDTFLKNVLNL